MAGIEDLSVASRKRSVFTFECREKLPGCPLVVDPSGLYFRPEGDKLLCGISPPADRDPDCDDFHVDHGLFEELTNPNFSIANWRAQTRHRGLRTATRSADGKIKKFIAITDAKSRYEHLKKRDSR